MWRSRGVVCGVYVVKRWSVGVNSMWCVLYTGVWSERGLCWFMCVCVCVRWSRCCLWQAVIAQPIKWRVTSKDIVYRHVCHPAVICHVCTSRYSIKSAFWRCHCTTCRAAWLYCGLFHTVESSYQIVFFSCFFEFPFSCEHSFICAVLLPFLLVVVVFHPLLPCLMF